MVQLSVTRCSCIAILWDSLVSFAAITLCVASQRLFIRLSLETFGYTHVFCMMFISSLHMNATFKFLHSPLPDWSFTINLFRHYVTSTVEIASFNNLRKNYTKTIFCCFRMTYSEILSHWRAPPPEIMCNDCAMICVRCTSVVSLYRNNNTNTW
jgi:hypothetical protein